MDAPKDWWNLDVRIWFEKRAFVTLQKSERRVLDLVNGFSLNVFCVKIVQNLIFPKVLFQIFNNSNR